MAKNPSPRNGDSTPPPIKIFIPKGFSDKAPEPEKRPVPEPTEVTSAEALSRIKGLGSGWDKELEALMAMPGKLYMFETETSVSFSKEREFGVGSVVSDMLRRISLREPKTEYGIALFETASTIYIVLVDMNRRIVVKHAVQVLHDEPPQKDWSSFKEAIKSAASVAEGKSFKKDGLIAYFDGILKSVKPEKD